MGAISGAFGSLGASAFGAGMKQIGLETFAKSGAGTVLSGMILGGVGSELVGGNFWQGAVIGGIVAGLNHAMHEIGDEFGDGDGPDPKKSVNTKKTEAKQYESFKDRLRLLADTSEEVGGWMEIGGVALAPLTGGGSIALSKVGVYFSMGGTAINVGIDIYDGDYKMATFRVVKQGVTYGLGKVIDRIPGVNHAVNKVLWKLNASFWEKVITPKIQPQKIK